MAVAIRRVTEAEMVEALLEEVERFDQDTPSLDRAKPEAKPLLPVLN